MPNKSSFDTKRITIKYPNAELLLTEFKAYLTANHPDLIKGNDIADLIYQPESSCVVHDHSMLHDHSFLHELLPSHPVPTVIEEPATLTFYNSVLYEAYKQFIQLPETIFKVDPKVVSIEREVDRDLVVSELKAYLTKNHPDLINDSGIIDMDYRPYRWGTATLTFSNPVTYEAYEQFIKLPATIFKLKPKVVQIEQGVNADLVVSELNEYLTENHPELIKNNDIVGLTYTPAPKDWWSTVIMATLTFSHPETYEAYKQFKNLPHIAFMLNPKKFILTSKMGGDYLISQFKTYLAKHHTVLIQEGDIAGLATYTNYDNQRTIAIGNKLVYEAFTEFNKQQFVLKKDNAQKQFVSHLGELNTKLSSLFVNDADMTKESENVYSDLMSIQKDFFEKITHNLNSATVKHHIRSFQVTCNERALEVDKLMGPGWLYRTLEVVLKAVLGLFVGVGMVVGSIFGQGLAKEEHRQKYHDLFFKWHKNEPQKVLSQFQEEADETLAELKKDCNESTDSERFKFS